MIRRLALALVLCGAAWSQGWTGLGNTSIFHSPPTNDVCPPNNYNGIVFAFNDTCGYLIDGSYSGGAADLLLNRLLMWGLGHAASIDNSIYAHQLNVTPKAMAYLTRPGSVSTSCYVANNCYNTPDTPIQPVAGHSYDCAVYLRRSNKFFVCGQMDYNGQQQAKYVWLANLNNTPPTWEHPTFTGTTPGASVTGASCIYDPRSDDEGVYVVEPVGGYTLARYSVTNASWTTLNNGGLTGAYGTVGIDPIRNKMYIQSDNLTKIFRIDLNSGSSYSNVDITSQLVGCSFWPGLAGVGMEWDTALNRFVLYPNTGNTVYIFDPGSMNCVAQTYSGGPTGGGGSTGQNLTGIFHRFSYFPALGVYDVVNNAEAQAYTLAINNTPTNGHGASVVSAQAVTCLDRDGDGYGVGPGCSGSDADDLDATVHTEAQCASKWGGTLSGCLTHLGYSPTNIYYLSPTGSDALSGGSPSCKNAIGTPCHTLAFLTSYLQPNDMVLMRGGTYTNIGEFDPPSGTSGKPIVIKGYPGELPYCDNVTTNKVCVNLTTVSWVVVDGIKARSGGTQAGAFAIGGQLTGVTAGIIIRYCEGLNTHNAPLEGFNLGVNVMLEFNVMHDGDCTAQGCAVSDGHNVYIGSNYYASADIGVYGNVIYNSESAGFQFNGRVTNLDFEKNIIYQSDSSTCVTFFQGITHSRIAGNLLFNCGNDAVDFADYDGDCYPPINGGVCPYDQNYNVIENNTIYMTTTGPSGNDLSNLSCWHLFNATAITPPRSLTQDLGHNTYRNNAFVLSAAATPIFSIGLVNQAVDSNNLASVGSSTYDHNIVYRVSDGGSNSNVFGLGAASPSLWTQYTWSSVSPTIIASSQVTGNLFSDPKFNASNSSWNTTPGNFDFHLNASTSPAVHAGSPSAVPLTDLYGEQRNWATPSIGAFELTPPPCGILTTSLPNGLVGVAYSQTVQNNGQCNSSSWTITSGSLCTGLSLNSSTGVISGTVSTPQTCSFTVNYDTGSQALSISITAPSTSGGTIKAGRGARGGRAIKH